MKMKFVRNGRTDRRELLVASQRGEALDEKRAKVLAADPSQLLLQFSYENQRSGALLRYDVEGLWSLRTFLAKRPLGMAELLGLMQATQLVLDLCTELHLKTEGLLFDPEYVFVNAQCCPRFVLMPFQELPFQERNSPLALLKAIGSVDHLRFGTPDAEGLSRRLGAFVLDQGGVFSANTYGRFLEGEQNAADVLAPEPEVRRSVVEGEATSTWAAAGSGTSKAEPVDSGSFFWSPLSGMVTDEEEKKPAVASVPAPAAQPVPTPVVAEVAPAPVTVPAAAPTPAVAPVPAPLPAPAPAPMPPVQPVAQRAWLVRASTGEQFPLTQGVTAKLGRGSGCDIRLLRNPRLSRTHAAVIFDGSQVLVTDLGAANGVWVNGVRLGAQQSLATSVGQTFRLADEDLYVRIG